MRRSIADQIAANKRASFFYAVLLILLLSGIGAAFAGIYRPAYWYVGAGGAALLGVIVAFVARFAGTDIVLSISKARQATPLEEQVVNNVAEEMALAAGIPKPQVYIIDDASPNAFATGMDPAHGVVVVSTGLIEKLNRDELQGVVAHEIGHIRNYDIRFMTQIALIAGLIPLLADLFRMTFWFGGGGRRDRDRDDSGLQAVFAILGLLLAVLAPIFAMLLQLAISRQREYLADATAAELTRYPEGLASALQKITSDPLPLQSANRATQHMYIANPFRRMAEAGESMLDTHPPTRLRIQRLYEMMGQHAGPDGSA